MRNIAKGKKPKGRLKKNQITYCGVRQLTPPSPIKMQNWCTPKLLIYSTTSPKMKTMEWEGVGVHYLVRNTLGVDGCARTLGWGLKRVTSESIIQQTKEQVG